MLKVNFEQRIVNGGAYIGENCVVGFNATIDSTNPDKIDIQDWITDSAAFRKNYDEISADRASFEKRVFTIQDEMKAALEGTNEK